MAYDRPKWKAFLSKLHYVPIFCPRKGSLSKAGTEDRLKEEMFKTRDRNSKHVECMKEYEKLTAAISNNIIPNVKSWANKLPSSTNAELRSKCIAANVVTTQNLSLSTFAPVLTGFKMAGAHTQEQTWFSPSQCS